MARRRMTLSQNFLHNPAAVHRVLRAAALDPGSLVIEPGAGEGALTRALAGACREVVAYELDRVLAARLPRRTRAHANVRVVRGDFLRARPPRQPFAVVGSIPYAYTSPIVRWCLTAPRMTSATLVTQLEYARKRTGGFGRWTLVTVRSWPAYEWRLAGRIPRRDFTPVPRTDSAVLRIERRTAPLLPAGHLAAYRDLVDEGFTGVGGSLCATLAERRRGSRVRSAFRRLGLDEGLPVGHVTPGQWLALYHALYGDGVLRARA